MRKISIFLIVFCSLLIVYSSPTHASYVTVSPEGKLVVKVLADQTEADGSTLAVTKLAENTVSNSTPAVTLTKNKDSVQMVVTNSDGTKNLTVPEKTDTLIEIEERPETQKISIGVQADQFFLRQKNYIALTNFPLTVDAQSAHLVAKGESGDTLLSILPMEAAESMLRSGIITKVTDNTMQLVDEDHGLQYKITGEKIFSVLNVYDYIVPVEAYVSVTDGSILRIDSSTWYRFMNFLVG
jgi:hypothetical protein